MAANFSNCENSSLYFRMVSWLKLRALESFKNLSRQSAIVGLRVVSVSPSSYRRKSSCALVQSLMNVGWWRNLCSGFRTNKPLRSRPTTHIGHLHLRSARLVNLHFCGLWLRNVCMFSPETTCDGRES